MIRDLLENGTILDIAATFIALALIAAVFLCLIYIIIGGLSFILSAGNEEKIKNAVNTIRYSIIGVIVSFLAFFFVSVLSKILDIPFPLNFGLIVDIMGEIINALR